MKEIDKKYNLSLIKFSKVYRFFLFAQRQNNIHSLNKLRDEVFIVLKERIFFMRFFFNVKAYKSFFYYKLYLLLHTYGRSSFFFPKHLNKSYFRVDFNKEHPYYSILTYKYRTRKVFSTGFLLKLHNLFLKKYRRKPNSYGAIIPFFKKFFLNSRLRLKTLAVIVGYRHKYNLFIHNLLRLLITKFCVGLFFELQTKMCKFKFRRVKSIKKRLKKSIIRNDKKLKIKLRLNKKK